VIDAANAFADALQEADQLLSPEAIAALAAASEAPLEDRHTRRS
jgi:hypothetical protein